MMILTAPCFQDVSTHAGEFMEPADDWLVVRPGTDHVGVQKPDGSWLCKIWRKAISSDLCALAEKCYLRVGKMVSTNRGYAAGATKRDQTYSTYEKGAQSNSGIMGFMDSANQTHPCRLTQFSRKHFEDYQRGLPFVRRMDECFATLMPDAHGRQKQVAQQNQFHIEGTAFSTITVNYNFRTALHVDSGDFRGGFGTLAICQKDITGGWILFPGFKTAIVLEHGDFIAMDVHEWHCNTAIALEQDQGYRLSFVGYLREKMVLCPEINRRIALAGGDTLTSERMIADIFASENETEKVILGTGPQGHEWWRREGSRFVIIYKYKRYTILDKVEGKKYHRLSAAWEDLVLSTRANLQGTA